MSGSIYLAGSEDVANAGRAMRNAGEEMSRAAGNLEDSLQRHRMFMDDWLNRLAHVLETDRVVVKKDEPLCCCTEWGPSYCPVHTP